MTIQTVPVAAPPKPRRTQFIIAAGAAVVISMATGIGAWRAGGDGGANVGEQPVAPLPAPTTPAARPAADTAPRYYLGASQEQAATLQAAMTEADMLLGAFGEVTVPAYVEVIDSAEAEAAFLQAVGEADNIRATLGLPPMRIVDLREDAR
jgi:hypothetical protein